MEIIDFRTRKVIHDDVSELRRLAWGASNVIDDYLFHSGDVEPEDYNKFLDGITVGEFVNHEDAERFKEMPLADLLDILCEFTRMLDPTEEVTKVPL